MSIVYGSGETSGSFAMMCRQKLLVCTQPVPGQFGAPRLR